MVKLRSSGLPIAIALLACLVVAVGCPSRNSGPAIGLSSSTMDFGDVEQTLQFEVYNSGKTGTSLSFEASSETAWISSIQPAQGASTGDDDRCLVTVGVDRAGLATGTYDGTIHISADGASSKNVKVEVTVGEGKVLGWVADPEGTMLPLVEVSLDGKAKTYTDGNGLFTFEGVSAQADHQVAFSLDGYTPDSRIVTVAPETPASLEVTLKRCASGKTLANGSGTASDNSGTQITLAGGDLVAGAGKSVTGNVLVQITALDFGQPGETGAAPGSFEVLVNGQTFGLEAYAAAHFLVTQSEHELSLQAGAEAEVRFDLPDDAECEAGDEIPLWYFDMELGVWVQVGTATVQVDGQGHLYCVGHVEVFGWFCVGVTIPAPHCIQGHVYDEDAQPLADAVIVAEGVDYCGLSFARSDAGGAYSLDVKPNASVLLKLIPAGGYYVVDTLQVASGAPGQCTTGQDLTVSYDSCISGTVTEEDGTPIANETVYSSTGDTAVTDATGHFCVGAPAGTLSAVYVIGRPPVAVETPATADCASGNCVDVTLSVDFPEDGDLVGYVVSDFSTQDWIFLPDTTSLSSMALLYSGFDGDQFGLYRIGAIADSYQVYTASFDPINDIGLYLGLTIGQSDLAFELVFNLDFNLNDMFRVEGFEVPEGNKIGALDAGSPGQLTNGTNTVAMVSPLDYFCDFRGDGSPADLSYAYLEPWMGGFFYQDGLFATNLFNYGDTLTYSWPGGIDLGAFQVSGDVPSALAFSATTNLGDLFAAKNLKDGLTIEWDATQPGDYITLMLETVVIGNVNSLVQFGAVVFTLQDDGSYTIPAEALAQLPHPTGPISLQTNYLFARRYSVSAADVPLARGNGDGYVALLTSSDPVWQWGLQIGIGKDAATEKCEP